MIATTSTMSGIQLWGFQAEPALPAAVSRQEKQTLSRICVQFAVESTTIVFGVQEHKEANPLRRSCSLEVAQHHQALYRLANVPRDHDEGIASRLEDGCIA